MNFIRLEKDGKLYYLNHVRVQRGMGNQKARECLIYGLNIYKHPRVYKRLLKELFTDEVVNQLLSMQEYLIQWKESDPDEN